MTLIHRTQQSLSKPHMYQAKKSTRPDGWLRSTPLCTMLLALPLAAQSRASRISDVYYHLSLELALAPDTDRVPGREEISLNLKSVADTVVLDFGDGSAANLTVNGATADGEPVNGHLIVPGHYFIPGRNRIALDFTS